MTDDRTSVALLDAMRKPGDERAWAEFYRRYAPMLAGVARKMGVSEAGAADAVQETMMAVHRVFAVLKEPPDRSRGSFNAWLMGIVRHKVQDQKRRRRRAARKGLIGRGEAFGDDETPVESAEAAFDPDDAEHEREFETQWRWCLLRRSMDEVAESVEPETFQAFQWYVLEGIAAGRVASVLGTTKNAVFLAKHKLLRRIRRRVSEIAAAEESAAVGAAVVAPQSQAPALDGMEMLR